MEFFFDFVICFNPLDPPKLPPGDRSIGDPCFTLCVRLKLFPRIEFSPKPGSVVTKIGLI